MSSKPSGSKGNMISKRRLKKKTYLTLGDKISIIKDYHKIGCQKGVLAALHNCYESQITYILKDEVKYLKEWAQKTGNIIVPKKTYKDFKFVRPKNSSERVVIGAVVYEWIRRVRNHGFSVSHDEIREVAEKVSKLINCDNFRATDLWINALMKKYRLTDLGPIKSKKTKKLSRKICDVKNILIDFKENGPPTRVQLKRSVLNDIDFSNLKLAQNKKVRTKSDNNSNSEVSDGYVTNATERTDFITAMLIDDGDEDASTSENRLSVEEETKDTTTANKNKEELKVQQFTAKTISSYKEALEYLRPLENFSLMQEDVRAIKRISKLESLFAEEVVDSSV